MYIRETDIMKTSILLTGSTGFIGRNIHEQLRDTYLFHIPSHKDLDLTDLNSVNTYFSSHPIDVVIHCASLGGRRNSLYIPDSVEKNLRMFFNIVRQKHFFKKMIYLGSGAEYDKNRQMSKVKESQFGDNIPQDQYGFYKYFCSRYAAYDPQIINLRLFGVFGKYEDYTTRFISNNI